MGLGDVRRCEDRMAMHFVYTQTLSKFGVPPGLGKMVPTCTNKAVFLWLALQATSKRGICIAPVILQRLSDLEYKARKMLSRGKTFE